MILFRCFAWNAGAAYDEADGPLWFPRPFQGEGRHDNPDLYGCVYFADRPLSCVAEQLARFRGQRVSPAALRRRGLPLALGELELAVEAELVDLDDPRVLLRERLRPSVVASRRCDVTQPQARSIYERHRAIAGVRWWSTYEALWTNVTVFDRAAPLLHVQSVRALSVDDPAIIEAAQFFAMPIAAL